MGPLPAARVSFFRIFGWHWTEEWRQAQRDHDKARVLLSDLGTETEWDGRPWRLAASSDSVRFSFLEQALADAGDCRRVDSRAKNVLQRSSASILFEKKILLKYYYHLLRINYSCLTVMLSRTTSTLLASRSTRSLQGACIDCLIEAIEKTTQSVSASRSLAEGLKAVLGKLEPAGRAIGVRVLVAAIGKTTYPIARRAVAEGLKAVLGKLEPADAQKAYAELVAAIEKTNKPYELTGAAEGLKAVPGKSNQPTVQKAYAVPVAAIEKTTNPYGLRALAEDLKAVPGKLDPPTGKRRPRAVAAVGKSYPTMQCAGGGSEGGVGQARTSRRAKGVRGAVPPSRKPPIPSHPRAGGGPEGGVGEARTSRRAKGVRGRCRRHRENHRSLRLSALAEGLKAVPGKARTSRLRKAYAAPAAAIEKTTNPYALRRWRRA